MDKVHTNSRSIYRVKSLWIKYTQTVGLFIELSLYG